MKKLLLALVFSILAILPTVGCTSEKMAKLTKDSVVSLSDQSGYPFCTGVAVGRNTVWTKHHCLENMVDINYNGKSCITDHVLFDDGYDNVLVETCQSYTKIAKMATSIPAIGSPVYFWGHFARLPALYRVGHVAAVTNVEAYDVPKDMYGPIYIFDFLSGPGDSGGPVFNSRGEVLCTLKGGFSDKIPFCVPHHFTKEQLKEL